MCIRDRYKIEEEVLYVNDDLFFSRDDENQIYVDVKKLVKKGYILSLIHI